MLGKAELAELLLIVKNEIKDCPYLRFGQSLWNNLCINYPQYSKYTATKLDCFYVDKNANDLMLEILDPEAYNSWMEFWIQFTKEDFLNFEENKGYL